jgi:hypothetical protein
MEPTVASLTSPEPFESEDDYIRRLEAQSGKSLGPTRPRMLLTG